MQPLVHVSGISKRFGGVQALQDVSVEFQPGEVHALMGENGAGKSTLGKIIAGAIAADSGRTFIDGREVTITSPLEAQRLGISIIFQELDLFPNLTVAENIVIGNLNYQDQVLVNRRSMAQFCKPFLERVGLDVSSNQSLGALPIGKMQQVAIARALSMNVRLIVMDESTSSLTDEAVDNLFDLIQKLRASGVCIAYVSHKLDEVFRICDRITVLRDGRFVATHEIEELKPRDLIKLMVGRDVRQSTHRSSHTPNPHKLLTVQALNTAKLHGISFELRVGEVLGVAGLVGAGRSELGAALFGLDTVHSGSIRLKGKDYSPRSPHHAVRHGLGLLPEDRKREGLMMQMGVNENASLSVLDRLSRFLLVRTKKERADTQKIYTETSLKAASDTAPVGTLSGGNQQKVLLARWLLVDPDVYFLDDPTRGVDVGAKNDIYAIIHRLAARGKGILMVSSELPELLGCCDRIMVLQDGRLKGTLDATTATQEQIMELATHVTEVS